MFEFFTSKGQFFGFRVSNDSPDLTIQQVPLLWDASQSLLQALKVGNIDVNWKKQRKVLDKEILALFNAIPLHDKFGEVVLKSLPREAWEKGLLPEEALKQRFYQVSKIARRFDLVSEQGSSLIVHFLSLIQSTLIIHSAYKISKKEVRDDPTDFSNLNTDEILCRAKFYIDRGDFMQALKYMNLLKGVPRIVARDWINDTRIFLEIEQAAKILMTHAVYSGMNNIAY